MPVGPLAFFGIYLLVAIPALITMMHHFPRGIIVPLRTDERLRERVECDLKNPTSEQILGALEKQTGISFTIDEWHITHPPAYGRLGPTTLKVWSAMGIFSITLPVDVRKPHSRLRVFETTR
jgi:hypothetical protein